MGSNRNAQHPATVDDGIMREYRDSFYSPSVLKAAHDRLNAILFCIFYF